MTNLTDIRNQIHHALAAQQAAEDQLKAVQKEYNAKLKAFEQENADLVFRLEESRNKRDNAKSGVSMQKNIAKVALQTEFLDELPEGFKQNRTKTVVYDPQGLRKQALNHFHHLLVLDEKAVNKFFTSMVEEQKDGSLIVPENIRSLASVEVLYTPKPTISDKTITALEIEPVEQSPVDENDETRPILNYCENCSITWGNEITCPNCGNDDLNNNSEAPVVAATESAEVQDEPMPLDEINF